LGEAILSAVVALAKQRILRAIWALDRHFGLLLSILWKLQTNSTTTTNRTIQTPMAKKTSRWGFPLAQSNLKVKGSIDPIQRPISRASNITCYLSLIRSQATERTTRCFEHLERFRHIQIDVPYGGTGRW